MTNEKIIINFIKNNADDADAVRHVGTFLEQEKPPTEVDGWWRTPKARRALRNANDDRGGHHG